jgi:hypothetical protein
VVVASKSSAQKAFDHVGQREHFLWRRDDVGSLLGRRAGPWMSTGLRVNSPSRVAVLNTIDNIE